MSLFEHDNPVTLEPTEHRYFDTKGDEYTSWSHIIKQYKEPFEAKAIAFNVAKARGISQNQVLDEWALTNKKAIDRGNYYHDNLEAYSKTGKPIEQGNEVTEMFIKQIGDFQSQFYYKCFEQALWLEEEKIAGTADLPVGFKAKRNGDQWIDIYDYKTNISKGIRYHSEYLKSFKYPINHLLECEYNAYALQLSAYALMAETTWKYKIRKLGIIYIPEDPLMWHIIPVPYMKAEARLLINNFVKNKEANATTV